MEERKKHKHLLAILSLLLAAAALAGGFFGWRHYQNTYITIDGVRYARSISTLDLSGKPIDELEKLSDLTALEQLDLRGTGISVQEYEALRTALPDCVIRWSLPFQGGFYDDDTQALAITTLTEADIQLLDYLPQLSNINATGCQDYDLLLSLQARHPNCDVSYNVTLGGETVSRNAKSLTLGAVTPDELDRMLPHFTQLEAVTLTGSENDTAALLDLTEKYPEIAISWELEVCGVAVSSLATEIDLSGKPIDDLAALEALAERLPNLKKVIMSDCGFSNEEMDALNRRHEDILFVWTVDIGPFYRLRTDVTSFIPVKEYLEFNDAELYNLRYCTEMVGLDLGHMPITNIDFVAFMPHLRYLIFVDARVSDLTPAANLKELVFLELFMTDVTDFSPLLTLTALEDLNISLTRAEGDMEVIAQMTWLDRLWWRQLEHTLFSPEEEAFLRESLPDTVMQLDYGPSTGAGWRTGPLYYEMRDFFGMPYLTE